ncbi:unnamed protein product [Triticum turgidum subsp. durum]|uniref:Uncharacterized protein n=1 Tax=Triticum turgidum subsp. durum TaxID=4567 RepID=A0A9R0SCI7_TRITD|nr:unnamed protein product [Triticum turgidum subsp. durum]
MALADVPLSLSPSSPHRAGHHVRLPTTPPPPLPPPSCAVAWASWSTARRSWMAGGRRHPSTAHALALAHRRPCPIPPSATTFPTPSSDLRRPLPSSSSSASTSSLLPSSSLNQGSPHLIRSRPRRASPTIGTRRWFGPGGGSCNPGVAAAVVPFRRHQGSTQRPRAASRAGQSANDAAALAMRRRLPWRTRRQQPWAWKTVLDPVSRRRCLVVKQRGPSAAPCPTSRPRGVSVALLDPASPCNRLCRQHLHEIVLVYVVQDQRQESAKYDDENKANDGELSSIEAEQSIGILSFNAHPKFQLPEIKASFSRCRSKLPHT